MKTILSAAIGAMLALSAIEAGAQTKAAERKVELAIEQQSLADALNEWAKQTGLQLVSSSSEMMNTTWAPRIKGAYTTQGALEELLKGTSLTYEWVSERAVVIREKSPVVPAALQSVGEDLKRSSLPIARFSGETREERRIAANDQPPTRGNSPARRSALSDPRDVEELEEIVVTGSRLSRRYEQGPTPVTTFDRKRIEEVGVTSVADVLDYLPQQSFTKKEGTTFAGTRVVQLRGLGVGSTLVLINGRRTVTSALLGDGGVFDLNSIPLAAVDRIEVLSDSASAVYGADAVGGVINVILKNRLSRPEVELYAGSADGGARERRATVSVGHDDGRFSGIIVVDGFDRQTLQGETRDLYANQDYTRFGGTDFRSTLAYPANIASLTGDNLPGISSPIAAVPRGVSGIGLTPTDFASTAGTTNLESLSRFQAIVPKTDLFSVTGNAQLQLSDSMSLFGELIYANRSDSAASIPPFVVDVVPAENPFNPFGEPVFVTRLLPELPLQRAESESEMIRSVLGMKGAVSAWDWEASLLAVDDKGSSSFKGRVDPSRLAASLAETDPALAVNVFGDGRAGTDAVLRSLLADPLINRNSSRALQLSGFARGPVASLPTGAVDMVFGAEVRSEKIHFEQKTSEISVSPDRRSSAVYSEIRIPLVSDSDTRLLARRVVLTLAGRYDHYDDFGDTFNPELGLQWKPIQQLLLRGSYGTSFRPPSLYELHAPIITLPTVAFDPRRGDEFALVESITGGNSDLDPEESRSYTFGFVTTLDALDPVRFGATYWRIRQTRRIQPLAADVLLANESDFSSRIRRADPSPDDLAAGMPGPLVSIDSTAINFGGLTTSGIDVELSKPFSTRIGTFTPGIFATHVLRYDAENVPNAPVVDRVGIASSQGTIPEWRAVATLSWSQGGWSITSSARYVSSYDDVQFDVPNGRSVPDKTLVDLQGAFSFQDIPTSPTIFSGVTVRLGVSNLFDSSPSYSEVSGSGVDSSQADGRQRFGYLSFTKSF